MPYLSVIVPTYNRADTLEACLQAIRTSCFRDYELIVVDNGSRNRSAKITRRYPRLMLREERKPGPFAVRNRGLSAAQG
jgi:glycosyltransferase involved in cell wall biosynthesis